MRAVKIASAAVASFRPTLNVKKDIVIGFFLFLLFFFSCFHFLLFFFLPSCSEIPKDDYRGEGFRDLKRFWLEKMLLSNVPLGEIYQTPRVESDNGFPFFWTMLIFRVCNHVFSVVFDVHSAFITLDDRDPTNMERSPRMRPPQGSVHKFHFRFSGMRAVKIASAAVAGFRPTLNARKDILDFFFFLLYVFSFVCFFFLFPSILF
ncbi:hypothetical protein CEXT_108141 [Caerostris extrusa]|uniref:Uncharacterized protein n=1 Tax=Caerostris extrusa TaxID=172846 RepID=A0AAV4XTE8_CAEEX|nr:hypothetical protein CEXT_108141 [Caerostris extrusa]